MADKVECYFCKKGEVHRYADSVCTNCEQLWEYVWDGVCPVLTEDQIAWLRSMPTEGKPDAQGKKETEEGTTETTIQGARPKETNDRGTDWSGVPRH